MLNKKFKKLFKDTQRKEEPEDILTLRVLVDSDNDINFSSHGKVNEFNDYDEMVTEIQKVVHGIVNKHKKGK